MSSSTEMTMLRPSLAQALDLLGKWVICRVSWGDGVEECDSAPAQVVGVVVPAPGTRVEPQLLMSSGQGVETSGYEFELYLDSIRFLRVIEPLELTGETRSKAVLVRDRFAAFGGVDLQLPERKDKTRAACFDDH